MLKLFTALILSIMPMTLSANELFYMSCLEYQNGDLVGKIDLLYRPPVAEIPGGLDYRYYSDKYDTWSFERFSLGDPLNDIISGSFSDFNGMMRKQNLQTKDSIVFFFDFIAQTAYIVLAIDGTSSDELANYIEYRDCTSNE